MKARHQAPFDPSALRLGKDLRRQGIDPTASDWHRIRRGVWLPTTGWASLGIDDRYRALVFATLLACTKPLKGVVAAHSAAALWGMPSIEPWPKHTYLLDSDGRSGSSEHIRMIHGPACNAMTRQGVPVTPPARTVIDLARYATLDTALAAADYCLRTQLCSRESLAAEVASVPRGARGRSKAGLVVDLTDGRSDSAGESLSRLQMFRGNFPRPTLQREFRDAQGLIGYTDFDWGGLIGEFDGKVKYRVPDDATAKEASDIVWREKQREDRLRRQKKDVARWVWATARSTEELAKLLIYHGLKPEPQSTWIDLGRSTPPPRR